MSISFSLLAPPLYPWRIMWLINCMQLLTSDKKQNSAKKKSKSLVLAQCSCWLGEDKAYWQINIKAAWLPSFISLCLRSRVQTDVRCDRKHWTEKQDKSWPPRRLGSTLDDVRARQNESAKNFLSVSINDRFSNMAEDAAVTSSASFRCVNSH